MKRIDKFLKKEKIDFFTLDEIESYYSGVLLLDSNFFHIIPLEFPGDIDEREREFEISEKLENIFEDYDSFDYLEKELILKKDNNFEKTLLILIEKDKIYTLLDNLKEKKINLLGIYPLFLVEIFNKDNTEKTYVEIEDKKYRLYYFFENKLIDFQELDFDKDELLSYPKYLEENLKGESFIYKNQEDIIDYFSNLKIRNWQEYSLSIKKDFSFLPNEYILNENYKKSLKTSTIFLSIITIISSILFFSIYFLRENIEKKIYLAEESYSILHEKNLQIREDILKLETEIKNLKENNQASDFNKIKLYQIIEAIFQNKDLEFTVFEYSDNTINLQGISNSENEIYKFQNSILQYKFFKKINHDFIKLKDDNYEFHIDIEVADDIAKQI